MRKFKNWLIDTLLKTDDLVAVPTKWQKEYVELAAKTVKNKATIAELMNEYNDLLKDYFKKCSNKELTEILKADGIAFKSTANKDDLVLLAYNEYKMSLEKK